MNEDAPVTLCDETGDMPPGASEGWFTQQWPGCTGSGHGTWSESNLSLSVAVSAVVSGGPL